MKKLMPIIFLGLCCSCAGDPGFENQRQETTTRNSPDRNHVRDADANRDHSAQGRESQTDNDEKQNDDDTSIGTGDEATGEDLNSGEDLGQAFDSRSFFTTQVMPQFADSCISCHADPRFSPPVQGPLTIFNFRRVENLLRQGEGPLSNDLYEKVAGIETHAGGDQCAINPTLCEMLEEWWQSLLGTSDSYVAISGEVSDVTEDGRVTGWAVDRGDNAAFVAIRVYANGDESSGVLVIETDADSPGYDNGASGNHAFSAQLPTEFRDGQQHTVHVYGVVGSNSVLLPGSPQTFTAYSPSPEGEAYFNNNIRSVLQNRCGSCHAVDYSIQWASLLSPAPDKGGTARNNELINKPSGQMNHGGGNLCGGQNGSPCSLFQEWWAIEFD